MPELRPRRLINGGEWGAFASSFSMQHATARIERDFGVRIAVKTVGTLLGRLGFVRLLTRPQHPNEDSLARSSEMHADDT